MSIEDMQGDLQTCIDDMTRMGDLVSANDVAKHLKNNLYPLLTNLFSELDEMDGSIADLRENAEDILQPETASVFNVAVAGAQGLLAEFENRLTGKPPTKTDAEVLKALAEWKPFADQSLAILEEITVVVVDEDEEEDEDDDDGDDDEEDDKEDDKKGGR